MDSWDGQERRDVDKDWLERDRMLSEIHSDMKYLLKWSDDHDRSDDKRFKEVNDKVVLGMWGVVVCVIIVVANGGLSAIKFIFNVH